MCIEQGPGSGRRTSDKRKRVDPVLFGNTLACAACLYQERQSTHQCSPEQLVLYGHELFIVEQFDRCERLTFQHRQTGSSTGADMRHLVFKPQLPNGRSAVAAADDAGA